MEPTRLSLASSSPHGQGARPRAGIRSLGEYWLLRRLGQGGMGAVYLGFKEGSTEPVPSRCLPTTCF